MIIWSFQCLASAQSQADYHMNSTFWHHPSLYPGVAQLRLSFHSCHPGPDIWLVFLQMLTKPRSFLACRWSILSTSVQQWGCGQQCERFCLGLGVGAGEARWERRARQISVKERGEHWDRGKVRKKITLNTPLKAAFLLLFPLPLSSAFFSRSPTPLFRSASFPSVSSQY